jgi:methyl-accepting chemotaxis protein
LAKETAEAIGEITQSSGKIALIVSEITFAAEEQARGVSQVNSAIADMDRITQANASASEELAASSEELSSQALSMNDSVGDLIGLVDGDNARVEYVRQSSIRVKPAMKKTGSVKKMVITHSSFLSEKSGTVMPESFVSFDDDNFGNY